VRLPVNGWSPSLPGHVDRTEFLRTKGSSNEILTVRPAEVLINLIPISL